MTALSRGVPFGLVVNSAARAVKRRYLRRPFWRHLVPDGLVRVTANLHELEETIAAFRSAGVRAVAVLGGDGSVHHLVDAVLHHYDESDAPMILALAGGTMNGVSRALGTGGAPAEALAAAVAGVAEGLPSAHARYVLRVSDRHAGWTRHGFSFAAGLVYRLFQRYYRSSEPGMVDAMRVSLVPLLAALFGGTLFDGLHLDVGVDDAPWLPEPPHTLVASVLDHPLLWFEPFGAPLGDASAMHVGAMSMRAAEIVPRLWSIFRGRCRHPRLRIGRSSETTVRGNTGYLIDGDLYPSGDSVDVRLSVGPRLRFLVPAEASGPRARDGPRSGR